MEEELLSNAMRGAVAVQQSRVVGKSEGPLGGGSRCSSGPRAAPLPQLLGLGRAAELCCPPRPGSIHHERRGVDRAFSTIHPSSPNLPFLTGDHVLPVLKPWVPTGLQVTSPRGLFRSVHPFLIVTEGGLQGGTCLPVHDSQCMAHRGKATTSLCSQPSRSWVSEVRETPLLGE